MRSTWIVVLGLMHDSDEYGVLRRAAKELALALGVLLKFIKELIEKGVMYGAEKYQQTPMIYTPKNSRVSGTPLTLIPVQDGPIWFSSRMVQDEYLRDVRGSVSRYDARKSPSPKGGIGDGVGAADDAHNPSPKGGIGEGIGAAPIPPSGDGASTSSSTKSKIKSKSKERAPLSDDVPRDAPIVDGNGLPVPGIDGVDYAPAIGVAAPAATTLRRDNLRFDNDLNPEPLEKLPHGVACGGREKFVQPEPTGKAGICIWLGRTLEIASTIFRPARGLDYIKPCAIMDLL